MKPIGLVFVSFFSILVHLGVLFIMLVLANVIPGPLQDAGIFYRYLGVAVIFSGYAAILLSAGQRSERARFQPEDRFSLSNCLLARDQQGRFRVRILNATLFAGGVFLALLAAVFAIAGLNKLHGQALPFGLMDPYLIATNLLLSVAEGISTPVIYRLEREFRGQ